MKRLLLAVMATICTIAVYAQLLTWTPPFPVENDPAQTLIITLDASKGNQGLLNHTPTDDVYVHLGVITNLSATANDWKYVKFEWGTANAQARASYIGNNKWKFTISGSLRSYFGITNSSETIQKIAILFRNSNGSKKQSNSDGSDMYVPVYTSALAVRITQPATEPRFTPAPEPQSWTIGTSFTVQAFANKASNMKLYHNGSVIASANGVQSISGSSTVSALGSQQIIAEANDGSVSRYDTLNIFVAPSGSPVAALPAGVRDGINYEPGNTSATLVLHAPGKNIVTVIGDFNNWTENVSSIMNKTPDGKKFWIRLTNLTPGVEYAFQYKVDDTLRIADPYVEKVLDPFNDPFITSTTYPNLKPYPTGKTSGIVGVLQTAAPAYSWMANNYTRPDKRGLIIYELLVRDFVAAHDWKTLRDTLNYLKNLGINAIEIMPFNEFEGNNSWGYNPNFYFAPDKYYGTKNSLKEFIDVCHQNGIAVIMDIALNHSFSTSPMVQLYFDRQNNRPAPNNPWFNPVAKHAFNVGYDMNHQSEDTRYFTSRVTEHWLREYKIDGFRFDLSKGFTQTQTCDNTGNNCNVNAWSNYDASRVAILKRYYDTVQTKSSNAYVILEHFADNTEEKELAEYGMLLWGNLNYNYTEAAMGYVSNSDFSWGIHTVRGWSKPHLITYMESHDEERIVYKTLQFGNATANYNTRVLDTALKRLELDAAFFFTIPGPKMIWQFGELGYDYSINQCTNGTVNNNCRLDPKPIRWDYFGDARRRHVYNTFSNLIKLRFHPWYRDAFISNRIEQSLNTAFKWIKVTTDTSNLLVVGNFDVNPNSGTVTFQNAGTWYDYLNNTTFTATGSAQNISLQPGEFHVYVNRNVNNSPVTPIISVPLDANALEAKVFPNPAQSTFTIDLNLSESGVVNLQLINVAGQKVTTLHEAFMIKGNHQLLLNRSRLNIAPGTYYIHINTKTYNKTLQITFQ